MTLSFVVFADCRKSNRWSSRLWVCHSVIVFVCGWVEWIILSQQGELFLIMSIKWNREHNLWLCEGSNWRVLQVDLRSSSSPQPSVPVSSDIILLITPECSSCSGCTNGRFQILKTKDLHQYQLTLSILSWYKLHYTLHLFCWLYVPS